jgi:hypothetical protein
MQAQRSPELREQMAAGQLEGRQGLAAHGDRGPGSGGPGAGGTHDRRRPDGAGLGLMIQWLTDETTAPTAGEVLTGLRALLGAEEKG